MRPLSLAGRACAGRLAVTVLAWLFAVAPAAARLVVMHGPAELTSAVLWIQTDAPGTVRLSWRPDGDAAERQLELIAAAAQDNVVVARLTGLVPGGRAVYRIEAGDERRDGQVRAQPWWSKAANAPPITIAIGSCFFLADADPRWGGNGYGGEYEVFDTIAGVKPDWTMQSFRRGKQIM